MGRKQQNGGQMQYKNSSLCKLTYDMEAVEYVVKALIRL